MSPERGRGPTGAGGRRSTRPADRSDLWWRTAVIYCLDIETFQDSDGDGVGDIDGLADRIEYLASLGVTCLWLMPFQRTEDLDDGYDVTDHFAVDQRLGDLGRFVELLRVAHDRGLRVIIDLVINHTSDQHPWFLSARSSRESPFRDYYVWRDEVPEDPGNSVFPGQEDGIWEYDRATEQYYLHNFYRHQPDLNLANPHVREEIARILGFWLQLGVDGFRIDAVPFLIEEPGAPDEQDPHAFLREMHRFVQRRSGEAALLGEVGLPHEEQLPYFGDGGVELDLQLDFLTAQTVFLAMARENAAPLARALADRPAVDASQGWAMFLRNHDELTLELLGKGPMREVFEAFAPDPRRRVFDRGIVRRLAPMLGNDPRRLRLAYSLMFSLPGAPVLYFGEEIGMGEPEDTDDRGGMRTPMQWEADPAGGFSGAPLEELPTPPTGGDLRPDRVNVRDQLRDPDSLLSYIRRLIQQYRSSPEIAWGELTVLDVSPASVLAHACVSAGAAFLAVHNLAAQPCTVRVPVGEIVGENARFEDLLAPVEGLDAAGGQITLELGAYGCRWLRAADLDPAP